MPRPTPRRDERGAVFVSTVVILGVAMVLASFVIDVGADRIARRDMQSVADVVALDVARRLDGRTASAYNTATLTAAKNNSLARNQSSLNTINPNDVSYQLWVADPATGEPLHQAGPTESPNAVKVTAAGTAGFRFLSSTPEGKPARSAVAVLDPPAACFSAGSMLADLAPGGTLDVVLGKLLGQTRLTAVSPNGLVDLNTGVDLLKLATQLGVGSVNEVADLSAIGARDFLLAAATVLSNSGDVAAANALNAIAVKVPSGQTIDVGEILNLDLGQGAAAAAKLDALSLLGATLMVANKNNFVDLGVPVNVPGLANVNVKLKIIEAPQLACGPVGTTARSAQIQLAVKAKVIDSALLNLVAGVDLDTTINVADGSGTIAAFTCGATNTMTVSASTAVARLFVGLSIKLLLGFVTVSLELPSKTARPEGATIATTSAQNLTFTYPADASTYPTFQTAGTKLHELGLSTITPIGGSLSLLGGLLGPVLATVDPLLTALLSPLLSALGLNLGTVDITPLSQVTCNQPSLRK